jgi:hypothetical protein
MPASGMRAANTYQPQLDASRLPKNASFRVIIFKNFLGERTQTPLPLGGIPYPPDPRIYPPP